MTGISRPLFVRAFFAFSLALQTLSSAWCAEDTDVDQTPELIFSDVAEDGLFFLNGEYVAAPYQVEATRDSITVNGVVCAIEFKPQFGGFGFERGEGFRGRGKGGGFGNRNRLGNRDRSEGESSGAGERSRPDSQTPDISSARWSARRLIDSLHQGQVVLLFEQTRELIAVPVILQRNLYETLLSETSLRKISPEISGIQMSPESSELWNAWLQEYSPPEQLRTRLKARQDQRMQADRENQRAIAAMHRLDNFSYPLTLVGMVVGVVALGHLLRWPRKEDEREAGSETVRAVGIALCLMMGMALIDLVWTILATQAGIMKEVNPLAEKLVDTPLQLAIFKTFATAVGFGIFYLWRTRRQIQVATWWMCLVCVLVTFRWVIFDSAMSP